MLILSLLIIVAVSYLSSMVSERQTADAYTAKARAEQIAQSGVDSATAILTESFRDFPDSATAWDTAQSVNKDGSAANEGTNLYLRAVPDANGLANPQIPAASGSPPPANDPSGNNPNNATCKTFVLPLISGVLKGQAQLLSNKAAALPTPMNVSEPDTTKQNFVDLNVRRSSSDTQGVIGSPPDWTGSTPKPARAYWVNLQGADGRTTGRYAFWIEDDSFRANISTIGTLTPHQQAGHNRIDNTTQPLDSGTGLPRALGPGDVSLPGFLNAVQSLASNGSSVKTLSPDTTATDFLNTRKAYPGGFFPDSLAFTHSTTAADGTASVATPVIDALHYLTTTQSGTLNFTRHGTKRLSLNGIFQSPQSTQPAQPAGSAAPLPQPVIQSAVNQIVETLKFHLPNFGQRFYRTSPATDPATLNAKQVASNNPGSDHATIYLYKVAANLCDYIDTDSQPTMILGPSGTGPGGMVDATPVTATTKPLDDEGSTNKYWAQGKESSPFIHEVAVRYRPVVGTVDPTSPIPQRDFDLQVDYYVEFWNMTDRDIYAGPQPGTKSKLPHLNGASVYVRDQQPWTGFNYAAKSAGDVFIASSQTTGELLPSNGDAPKDWQLDLSSSAVKGYDPSAKDLTLVQDGSGNTSLGVCFKAGSVTVITTDPDCFKDHHINNYSYIYKGPYSAYSIVPDNYGNVANPANVYLCPVISGQRDYKGHVVKPGNLADSGGGITPAGGYTLGKSTFSGTEISLANSYGYMEIVRGAITKTPVPGTPGNPLYTNSFKSIPPKDTTTAYYNDYSFGGALIGNVAEPALPKPPGSAQGINESSTPSELGDPRTNNEQLSINITSATSNNPDGSHYMPGTRTLGTPNGITVKPDQTTGGATGWGDYFAMPASNANPDATNAPAVIGDGPLTSIGQLGDVFDPARVQGTGGIQYSRGGGRTFKLGQHDDLYTFDPIGSPAGSNTSDFVSASTGWASWRLADVFSVDDNQESPGRININGVPRDKGAALLAALDGWNFQPVTSSGTTTDPTIHGDGHGTGSLANAALDTSINSTGVSATADPSQHGALQIINQIMSRLNPSSTTTANSATPRGPFFERGEFGELGAGTLPIFGVNGSTTANTALVANVDMNKTFDHGREEMFRRLAELICTRGDTFTVYTVGQSIFQAPVIDPAKPPPLKVTGTHRLRVTFRLVPKATGGKEFIPQPFDGTNPTSNPISAQVATRFARPDRYDAQILEVSTF